MKKILLLIIGLSMISISSKAQSTWNKIYAEGDIVVEMKTEDCNPFSLATPNTYALLKYTNVSNKDVEFKFEINRWYNNNLQDNTPKDAGDPSAVTTINISANSSIVATCNSKEHYLKIFYKHNHPEIDNKLTKIVIQSK